MGKGLQILLANQMQCVVIYAIKTASALLSTHYLGPWFRLSMQRHVCVCVSICLFVVLWQLSYLNEIKSRSQNANHSTEEHRTYVALNIIRRDPFPSWTLQRRHAQTVR